MDYTKVVGELAFPWMFEGYYFAALPRFSQVASLGGVWLLTFFALFFVTGVMLMILERKEGKKILLVTGILFLCGILYGEIRLAEPTKLRNYTVAILQPHFDQATWDDDRSLGEQLAVNDSLMTVAGEVDLFVLPESGMYCYYRGSFESQIAVREAREKFPSTAILFGTLDFRRYSRDSIDVFNAMMQIPPYETNALVYHKEKLVPFAETVPLKGVVPLLSRLEKLGVSNFVAGKERAVWYLQNSLAVAPTICYEGIFPNYIRERKKAGAEVIINGTNDGWFGLSQGPYQHALMTRLRAIESAIPVVRCANSGISFVTDSRGRYVVKSKLLTREVLQTKLPMTDPQKTLYYLWGDWVVGGSFFMVLILLVVGGRNKKGGQKTA